VLSIATGGVLVWILFGPGWLGGPTRLLVGLPEVGAIARRQVPVLGAKFAVT
jgi:hypothetical protein